MNRGSNSTRRMTFVYLLIVLPVALLACSLMGLPSQGNGTAVPSSSTGGEANPPTRAPVPDGWKVTQDATGTCQVATPPEWQLGSDFFLAVEEPDPGPFQGTPGAYPPSGLALWGMGTGTPAPEGRHFQIRTSRVIDGQVCSVWRIKADVDFTDAEKSEMEQVGATLQEVQR